MRELSYGMDLSLDGYIPAPGDDLGWDASLDDDHAVTGPAGRRPVVAATAAIRAAARDGATRAWAAAPTRAS